MTREFCVGINHHKGHHGHKGKTLYISLYIHSFVSFVFCEASSESAVTTPEF